MIYIRVLTVDDLCAYKSIRLELLKNEPVNFGSSYDEENSFDDSFWANRLTNNKIIVFGAFDQETLVGISLAVTNPRKKIKHIATLNSMYVKKEYQNKGIGKKLIIAVIKFLKDKDVEILNLSVVTTNIAGINLYKHFGFTIYGEEKKGIKLNNKYIDMYLMTLEL